MVIVLFVRWVSWSQHYWDQLTRKVKFFLQRWFILNADIGVRGSQNWVSFIFLKSQDFKTLTLSDAKEMKLLWPCDWWWKTNNSESANCDPVTKSSVMKIIPRTKMSKKWFVILLYDLHPFGQEIAPVKFYHKSITVWAREMKQYTKSLKLF